MPIDIKYNPFDFGNAVTDPTLFIGRDEQLNDLRYYFNEAMNAPRPCNLAILGPRSSGKTSLMNMAALEAKRSGLCVARVDLNADNVKSPLILLFKIFSSLLDSAVDMVHPSESGNTDKCFGGRTGDVYLAYLDTISTFSVPESSRRRFTFPVQYAMAMKAGRESIPIVENAFIADLQEIQREVARPIALMFDECNLLADKQSELQLIRNVFMNTAGYMLLFSGTPEMFPVMNDVFSPIARSFKKIELAPFKTQTETHQAIAKPLKTIGMEPGLSSIPHISEAELDDIHQLTGGKPHEIQLVCHCMVRQMQDGKKTRISLDVGVLNEVLVELRKTVDINTRPVISEFRKLDEVRLGQMAIFMQASDATFAQYQAIEMACKIKGRPKVNAKTLQHGLDVGIFKKVDEKIVFAGDDFDRVYCRYYASHRGVNVYFNFVPVEEYFRTRVVNFLYEEAGLAYLFSSEKPVVVTRKTSSDEGDTETNNKTIRNPYILQSLFILHFEAANCGVGSIPNIYVGAKYNELACGEVFVPGDIRRFDIEIARACIRGFAQRLEILGGKVNFSDDTFPAEELEAVRAQARTVLQMGTVEEPMQLEKEFYQRFMEVYTERHDVALTTAYAEALCEVRDHIPPHIANNMGYFYMVLGDHEKARIYLEATNARFNELETDTRVLVNYNLAIYFLRQGNVPEARHHSEIALRELEGRPFSATCLLIPLEVNKSVVLRETWNPSYVDALKSLNAVLDDMDADGVTVDSPLPIEFGGAAA